MISGKARSIAEMVYGLVEEYDPEFQTCDEIILYLADESVLAPSKEKQNRKLTKFKKNLEECIGSFFQFDL